MTQPCPHGSPVWDHWDGSSLWSVRPKYFQRLGILFVGLDLDLVWIWSGSGLDLAWILPLTPFPDTTTAAGQPRDRA